MRLPILYRGYNFKSIFYQVNCSLRIVDVYILYNTYLCDLHVIPITPTKAISRKWIVYNNIVLQYPHCCSIIYNIQNAQYHNKHVSLYTYSIIWIRQHEYDYLCLYIYIRLCGIDRLFAIRAQCTRVIYYYKFSGRLNAERDGRNKSLTFILLKLLYYYYNVYIHNNI